MPEPLSQGAAERHPIEVRDQAYAVMCKTLGRKPDFAERFGDMPTLATVQVLLALEEAFAIPLDCDEVLPGGTVASLLIMVQARVFLGRKVHGPDTPFGKPSSLVDLAAARRRLRPEHRKMLKPGAAVRGEIYAGSLSEAQIAESDLQPEQWLAIADGPPCEAFAAPDRARRARPELHVGAAALAALAVAAILAIGVGRDLRRLFSGFGR